MRSFIYRYLYFIREQKIINRLQKCNSLGQVIAKFSREREFMQAQQYQMGGEVNPHLTEKDQMFKQVNAS